MRGPCLFLLLCVTARCASSSERKACEAFADQITGARGIAVFFSHVKHGDEAEKASQKSLARVVEEEFRAMSTLPIRFEEVDLDDPPLERQLKAGFPIDRERCVHREGWVVVRVGARTYPRSSIALRGLIVVGDFFSIVGGGKGFTRYEKLIVSLPPSGCIRRTYWKGTLSDPVRGRKEVRKLLARLWKGVGTTAATSSGDALSELPVALAAPLYRPTGFDTWS
ncbi:MAG: hypothetical protein ACYS0K_22805 [Planctomycetota bacterium]|jgi:hypothetical protein